MKTLAACLFTSVLAADNGEPLDFSIPLRETVGEGKTLFFADHPEQALLRQTKKHVVATNRLSV